MLNWKYFKYDDWRIKLFNRMRNKKFFANEQWCVKTLELLITFTSNFDWNCSQKKRGHIVHARSPVQWIFHSIYTFHFISLVTRRTAVPSKNKMPFSYYLNSVTSDRFMWSTFVYLPAQQTNKWCVCTYLLWW